MTDVTGALLSRQVRREIERKKSKNQECGTYCEAGLFEGPLLAGRSKGSGQAGGGRKGGSYGKIV